VLVCVFVGLLVPSFSSLLCVPPPPAPPPYPFLCFFFFESSWGCRCLVDTAEGKQIHRSGKCGILRRKFILDSTCTHRATSRWGWCVGVCLARESHSHAQRGVSSMVVVGLWVCWCGGGRCLCNPSVCGFGGCSPPPRPPPCFRMNCWDCCLDGPGGLSTASASSSAPESGLADGVTAMGHHNPPPTPRDPPPPPPPPPAPKLFWLVGAIVGEGLPRPPPTTHVSDPTNPRPRPPCPLWFLLLFCRAWLPPTPTLVPPFIPRHPTNKEYPSHPVSPSWTYTAQTRLCLPPATAAPDTSL